MKNMWLITVLVCLSAGACSRRQVEHPPADRCFIAANIDGRDYRWTLAHCSWSDQRLRVGDITSDEAELTLRPVSGTGTFLSSDPDLEVTFFLTLGPGLQIFAAQVNLAITTFSEEEARGSFEGIFTDIGGTNYRAANGTFRAVF